MFTSPSGRFTPGEEAHSIIEYDADWTTDPVRQPFCRLSHYLEPNTD